MAPEPVVRACLGSAWRRSRWQPVLDPHLPPPLLAPLRGLHALASCRDRLLLAVQLGRHPAANRLRRACELPEDRLRSDFLARLQEHARVRDSGNGPQAAAVSARRHPAHAPVAAVQDIFPDRFLPAHHPARRSGRTRLHLSAEPVERRCRQLSGRSRVDTHAYRPARSREYRPHRDHPGRYLADLRSVPDLLDGRATERSGRGLRGSRPGRCQRAAEADPHHASFDPASGADHHPARTRQCASCVWCGRDPDRGRSRAGKLHRLLLHLQRSVQRGSVPLWVWIRGGPALRGSGIRIRDWAGRDRARRRARAPGVPCLMAVLARRPAILSRRRRLRRNVYLNLIALPGLLIVSLVWAYPFLWTVSTAFKTQLGAFTAGAGLLPQPLDLDNFKRAWVTAGFSSYTANSFIYAVSSTLVELIKSALCGYVLARYRFPGRDLLYKIIVLTLFVPVVSIVLPQFVLIEHLGLLNSRLGVILAQSGGAGALYVLLFTGFFENLPQELFDAARVDGAGFLQTFWLMLPLARPIIAVVVIFQFVYSWNDFTIPLIFTLGQPNLQNLAVGMLYFQGTHTFDWTGFAAGILMSFTPVLLVFQAFQGYFVRGLAGAVKG